MFVVGTCRKVMCSRAKAQKSQLRVQALSKETAAVKGPSARLQDSKKRRGSES